MPEDTDNETPSRRRLTVVLVAVALIGVMFLLQWRIEANVRDNDLPDSCAIRGQSCPTTTSMTGVFVP